MDEDEDGDETRSNAGSVRGVRGTANPSRSRSQSRSRPPEGSVSRKNGDDDLGSISNRYLHSSFVAKDVLTPLFAVLANPQSQKAANDGEEVLLPQDLMLDRRLTKTQARPSRNENALQVKEGRQV